MDITDLPAAAYTIADVAFMPGTKRENVRLKRYPNRFDVKGRLQGMSAPGRIVVGLEGPYLAVSVWGPAGIYYTDALTMDGLTEERLTAFADRAMTHLRTSLVA